MTKWWIGSMALAAMATMAQPRARAQQDYPDMQPYQPMQQQPQPLQPRPVEPPYSEGEQQQNEMQPAPPPDFGALQMFMGHLTCSGTAMAPDGTQRNTTIEWNGRTDLAGQILTIRGQEQPSDLTQGETPMQFLAVIGYDQARQRFVAFAFDSEGAREQDISNANVVRGNAITFTGHMVMPNGQSQPVRETFTRAGRGSFRWIGEGTVNGRAERLMDLTCQR